MNDATDNAKSQALAQASSIVAMVAALECDYDRLEKLRDELKSACDDQAEGLDFAAWVKDQAESGIGVFKDAAAEYLDLADAAGDCTSQDDAARRIQEDPLSVEMRSGWYAPGATAEPEEFNILLCTGGPAVRIMGELDDHNQPSRAWIEYQDWFTPWVQLFNGIEQTTLLTYCQQFYFGE